MKYPAVEKLKYSEIRYPNFGAVINDKGEMKPMSGDPARRRTRAKAAAAPSKLLLNALDAPQNVSAIEDQKLGNQTLPAAVFTQGANKYIIMFDRTTKLPAAVRIRDEDNIWGDAELRHDATSDWKTVNGVKMRLLRAPTSSTTWKCSGSTTRTSRPIPTIPRRPPSRFRRRSRRRQGPATPRPTCPTSGWCGGCSSAASPTATRSTSATTAASSSSSSHRTSRWSRAAAPTT